MNGHFLNGCTSWVVHAQCFCSYQLVSLTLRQQAADVRVVTVLYACLMPFITLHNMKKLMDFRMQLRRK